MELDLSFGMRHYQALITGDKGEFPKYRLDLKRYVLSVSFGDPHGLTEEGVVDKGKGLLFHHSAIGRTRKRSTSVASWKTTDFSLMETRLPEDSPCDGDGVPKSEGL